MDKPFSHTQVSPQKHTTEFMKGALALGARYGGRWLFGMLEEWGKISTRTANSLTSLFSGMIAGGITAMLAFNVRKDIKSVFAETVAMEHGKQPHEIEWADLKTSDNVLVQETLSNFKKFNVLRSMGVAGFALGALPFKIPGISKIEKGVDTGEPVYINDARGMELGMGTFSASLLYDIQRKTTFFEQLNALVQTKFSASGMGQALASSDLAILYQRYAQKFAPALEFSDISDVGRWNASEILFERMAVLMEHSYRPRADVRAIARGEADEIRIQPQENFKMPKFLYLLGHNLINPEKVRESLAYVEIANSYGIEAVKEVQQALKKGATLERCMEKYPVMIPGESLPVVTQGVEDVAHHPTRAEQKPRFTDKIQQKSLQEEIDTIKTPAPIASNFAKTESRVAQFAVPGSYAEKEQQKGNSKNNDMGLVS